MDPFVRDALAQLNRRLEKLVRRGLYRQAIETAEEICQLIRKQLGETHPLLLYALGDLHAAQRQFDSAEKIYEEAIRLGSNNGRTAPRLLADALIKQAQTKAALGKQEEAAALAGQPPSLTGWPPPFCLSPTDSIGSPSTFHQPRNRPARVEDRGDGPG